MIIYIPNPLRHGYLQQSPNAKYQHIPATFEMSPYIPKIMRKECIHCSDCIAQEHHDKSYTNSSLESLQKHTKWK